MFSCVWVGSHRWRVEWSELDNVVVVPRGCGCGGVVVQRGGRHFMSVVNRLLLYVQAVVPVLRLHPGPQRIVRPTPEPCCESIKRLAFRRSEIATGVRMCVRAVLAALRGRGNTRDTRSAELSRFGDGGDVVE